MTEPIVPPPGEPRELTADEVRDAFLRQVSGCVDYWLREDRAPTAREKLGGLTFSILVMLDGESIGVPGFIVAPMPHPDDAEYDRSEGENWWPQNHEAAKAIKADIAGWLHELWHAVRRRESQSQGG